VSFTTTQYLAFFVAVAGVLSLIRPQAARRTWLLLASYVFYGWWDPRFTVLLALVTVANWWAARIISASQSPSRRKAILVVMVVADVLLLGVFKYYGFFVDSLSSALRGAGTQFSAIQLVVPLAISFITFQVISYVVDVYRGDVEPAGLIDVGLLVAFFPHVVAGPILKPAEFLPQLQKDFRSSWSLINSGAQTFLTGAVLKLLVADRLALFVDPVMGQWQHWSAGTLLLGVLAYALQIYADFAGYTAMAIGSAQMLGLELPRNFDAPYTSLSITEFWRRWHMSLSRWLREYVYFPLGGNRRGPVRQNVNLVATFLVAGIWHGAAWHFVLWGVLHGLALVVHKAWLRLRGVRGRSSAPTWWGTGLAWFITFAFVCVAWVYFRMPSVAGANSYLSAILHVGAGAGVQWFAPAVPLSALAVIGFDVLTRRFGGVPTQRLTTFRGAAVITLLLIALITLAPSAPTPFIYAQF